MFVGITSRKSEQLFQFPIVDGLADAFALLVANINKTVIGLSSTGFQGFKRLISERLKAKSPGSHGFLPSTAEELMRTLSNYWNSINFGFAQLVVKCLEDERLQQQMRAYEELARSRIELTIQECIRKSVLPVPPPKFADMAIRMNVEPLSYSLYCILEAKDFLVHGIGLSTALFAGFVEVGMSDHSTSDILLHEGMS